MPIGPPTYLSTAAWTGHEVLVWGHSAAQPAAGYDPATREWRPLPPAPLSARYPFAALWTGTEFIVWGDLDRTAGARDGAAYDPRIDRWRPLRPAPIPLNQGASIWTGQEMIVVGAALDDQNYDPDLRAAALAYNPRTDRWLQLGSPGLRPDISPNATWAVWTGDRLLVWDWVLEARAWTPARGWRRLDHIPLQERDCYPKGVVAGPTVLMTYCDQAAILRPDDHWEPVPVPGKDIHATVVAGARILMWTEQGAWTLATEP